MIKLSDIEIEIDQTIDELKEARVSSHKDWCMQKLEALYKLLELMDKTK